MKKCRQSRAREYSFRGRMHEASCFMFFIIFLLFFFVKMSRTSSHKSIAMRRLNDEITSFLMLLHTNTLSLLKKYHQWINEWVREVEILIGIESGFMPIHVMDIAWLACDWLKTEHNSKSVLVGQYIALTHTHSQNWGHWTESINYEQYLVMCSCMEHLHTFIESTIEQYTLFFEV
jgi:hypothetical protein